MIAETHGLKNNLCVFLAEQRTLPTKNPAIYHRRAIFRNINTIPYNDRLSVSQGRSIPQNRKKQETTNCLIINLTLANNVDAK
ncbi:MAG TPA: hypothetical protein PK174_04130, partial [Anaerolineaceae bacterium]|nr:hypothetical protein [Anaerolineaceae bacterium]